MMSDTDADNTSTVLILFFILVILVVLLFFLYKRLNHETKNKYTIRQLIYSEGGLRDRVMQGVALVEARLGDHIRSRPQDEEQALSNNEDDNNDKEDEDDGGLEDKEPGNGINENKTEEKGEENHNDSSDDYSSIDLRERVKQNNSKEEEEKEQEQEEEDVEKDKEKEDDSRKEENVKNDERVGLLVDLEKISGSAIWSEEKKEELNVTAL